MPDKTNVYGYDSASGLWVPILVNAAGKLIIDPSEILEEPPTDGETAKAADSNWSYDHWHDPNAHHTRNADIRIQDADADTKIEVEQSADEDTIRMTNPAGEVLNITPAGIVSLAKQSGCHVNYAGGQYLAANNVLSYLLYDTKVYDIQGEFNVGVKTGSATATSAGHLVDTTSHQFVAGDVGSFVWNTTSDKYAQVTAFNSTSDVTLDTNIMASGNGYKLYRSRFTAVAAGLYYTSVSVVQYANGVDGAALKVYVLKNGVAALFNTTYGSGAGEWVGCSISGLVQLAAGDNITLGAVQEAAVAKQLAPYSYLCFAQIAKIA